MIINTLKPSKQELELLIKLNKNGAEIFDGKDNYLKMQYLLRAEMLQEELKNL